MRAKQIKRGETSLGDNQIGFGFMLEVDSVRLGAVESLSRYRVDGKGSMVPGYGDWLRWSARLSGSGVIAKREELTWVHGTCPKCGMGNAVINGVCRDCKGSFPYVKDVIMVKGS